MIEINLLSLSIGIGLVVSLLFVEAFGLAAGGLVVPGYVALHLTRPMDVALTMLVAWLTFAIVKLLSSYLVIYGRRRTVLMILLGYLLGATLDYFVGGGIQIGTSATEMATSSGVPVGAAQPLVMELSVIGYIIPGLLAIWLDRQGVWQTFAGLVTTSAVVRLLLILIMPAALLDYEMQIHQDLAHWLTLWKG